MCQYSNHCPVGSIGQEPNVATPRRASLRIRPGSRLNMSHHQRGQILERAGSIRAAPHLNMGQARDVRVQLANASDRVPLSRLKDVRSIVADEMRVVLAELELGNASQFPQNQLPEKLEELARRWPNAPARWRLRERRHFLDGFTQSRMRYSDGLSRASSARCALLDSLARSPTSGERSTRFSTRPRSSYRVVTACRRPHALVAPLLGDVTRTAERSGLRLTPQIRQA